MYVKTHSATRRVGAVKSTPAFSRQRRKASMSQISHETAEYTVDLTKLLVTFVSSPMHSSSCGFCFII